MSSIPCSNEKAYENILGSSQAEMIKNQIRHSTNFPMNSIISIQVVKRSIFSCSHEMGDFEFIGEVYFVIAFFCDTSPFCLDPPRYLLYS